MKKLACIASAVLLSVGLAACSSDDADSESSSSSTTSTSSTEAAFPATVSTKFGDITVEEEPQRVVALGWGDAETALALDVQPVGASDWLDFGGDGVGPWADGLYDESPEIIGTMEPSYEAIAALEPDLILDVKSSGDQERYDRLSEIATTVGVPEGGDSYLTTMEQQVDLISTALGKPDQGQQLLDEVSDAFQEQADAHPEWADMTMTAVAKDSNGWGAYIEGSSRVTFMENLGFSQNPDVADLPTSETGFSVDISAENLDVVDADVIIAFPIYIETSELTDDSAWQAVPAVADGHAIVLEGDLSQAYAVSTTLSTQYAIENLVPMLEDATSGE